MTPDEIEAKNFANTVYNFQDELREIMKGVKTSTVLKYWGRRILLRINIIYMDRSGGGTKFRVSERAKKILTGLMIG